MSGERLAPRAGSKDFRRRLGKVTYKHACPTPGKEAPMQRRRGADTVGGRGGMGGDSGAGGIRARCRGLRLRC